jgi:hypothetical protein
MLPNPEASVTSIAKLLGVSPGTLYNHIPTYANSAPPAEPATNSPPPNHRPARSSSPFAAGDTFLTSRAISIVNAVDGPPRPN